MSNSVDCIPETDPMYHDGCPKNGTEEGPRIFYLPEVDYSAMAEYIRRRPEKLVSFVAERLCDDDFREFVRELYDYICDRRDTGPHDRLLERR